MKLQEANENCIDLKFWLYWNRIDWVDSGNRDRKNNPFFDSTFKYCIKDRNEYFRFVGQ